MVAKRIEHNCSHQVRCRLIVPEYIKMVQYVDKERARVGEGCFAKLLGNMLEEFFASIRLVETGW